MYRSGRGHKRIARRSPLHASKFPSAAIADRTVVFTFLRENRVCSAHAVGPRCNNFGQAVCPYGHDVVTEEEYYLTHQRWRQQRRRGPEQPAPRAREPRKIYALTEDEVSMLVGLTTKEKGQTERLAGLENYDSEKLVDMMEDGNRNDCHEEHHPPSSFGPP